MRRSRLSILIARAFPRPAETLVVSIGLACGLVGAGCHETGEGTAPGGAGADESGLADAPDGTSVLSAAREKIERLAGRGELDAVRASTPAPATGEVDDERPRPLLGVKVASVASQETRVVDAKTGVGVSFALADAKDVAMEDVDGYAVYAAAGPGGADVVVRASTRGVEDYVRVKEPLPRGALRYRMTLHEARALRLVGGTLEVLDADGSPRLRVPRPYVIDAHGARHDAALEVEGCEVDRDPRSPWGRALVELDEASCDLVVRYDTRVAHPVWIDPAWDPAALMAHERTHHTATLLPDGTVLVVGGFDAAGAAVAEAEILCPEESICPGGVTFAATGSLPVARGAHAESLVGTSVLISGGRQTRSGTTALSSTAVYATTGANAGTFVAGPTMAVGRMGHTSTLLSTGNVLVAGGEDGTGTSTAEVYDPTIGAVGSFGAAVAMVGGHRRGHMAETLGNGKVLVAGGVGAINNAAVSSAELFDPSTGAFAATDDMTSPRAWGTATRLQDASGSVLITGGTNNVGFYYKTVDLYDPTVNGGTFVQQLIQTQKPRAFHAAVKLSGVGQVLITGGFDGSVIHDDTEVFDAVNHVFVPSLSTTMTRPHDFHTATLLQTGKAVVIGGGITGTPTLPGTGTVDVIAASQAEILARENGEPCDLNGECRDNHCYQGVVNGHARRVCCNETCADVCGSCLVDIQAAPAPGDGFCAVVEDNHDVSTQCVAAVQLVLQCNGGAIQATNIQSCGNYVCADGTKCGTQCTDDDGCNTGFYCLIPNGQTKGTCEPKLDDAADCTRNGECDSDHCVDAKCCDTACEGQCEACDVEGFVGKCSQVEGDPHDIGGLREACDATDEACRGTCGSTPTACDYDQTKECGASTCSDGHRTFGLCSLEVNGACAEAEAECSPFACDEDGVKCVAACETVDDCAPKAVCGEDGVCKIVQSDQCDGDHTVVKLDGGTTDCSPLRCSGSACLASCESIDDCVDGKVCDATGACIDPPPDPPAPDDCAAAPGRPSSRTSLALSFLVLALVARRRAVQSRTRGSAR